MPLPQSYRETRITPKTSRMVEALWSFVAPHAGHSLVLPDGRCDIILRDTAQGTTAVITGPATRAYRVHFQKGDRWRGVRLRPETGRFVWQDQLAIPVDQVLIGPDAVAALPVLRSALVAPDPMAVLAQALQIPRARPAPAALSQTLDAVHTSGGRLSVRHLAARSGWTPRHLTRMFRKYVGLGPKTYGQIVQFHRALRLIKDHQLPLSAAAHEAGYADHPHMTRAFARFGGFSPARLPADLDLPGLGSI